MRNGLFLIVFLMLAPGMAAWSPARASDHLDTPTVAKDPRADIGDIYAWTAPDGRRLNLVMTIVGRSFSDRIAYTFHVDSGNRFGETTASTTLTCRFSASYVARCELAGERADGMVDAPDGFASPSGRLRVFIGRRDDPFFNNVKGSRSAFEVAAAALKGGVSMDEDGFPAFDAATVASIREHWRQTDGGPGRNFLAGWTPSAIVATVDLGLVNTGGSMLAVWGETATDHGRIDRAGRPLTGNALLAPLAPDTVSDRLKERYNRAEPATSAQFVSDIQRSLGLYDGYDGIRGNQWLADTRARPGERYKRLAVLLADDRLWVNVAAVTCTQLFAVELAALSGRTDLAHDCGGRTPNYDASNVYRSMLAAGDTRSIDDGVHRDDRVHSPVRFPFLAAAENVVPATKADTGANPGSEYRE
ncbi:DUF4331 domain-containing protein [Luteibacter sp. SG786]|uniref:DUF4331 domain-containing protein n=1 Tax=Luteibacter sp. SG786 TaxID=2587130 RepID=UPI00141FA809|nr:DUF4331 domain-containing protein [Luteibacter sp. SG786]NII55451.1 hypothetical protein [Luteibacter sp. SG786]